MKENFSTKKKKLNFYPKKKCPIPKSKQKEPEIKKSAE